MWFCSEHNTSRKRFQIGAPVTITGSASISLKLPPNSYCKDKFKVYGLSVVF
ncbi:hypothetical protein LguiA_013043 [Lonicera macranthoides]